MFIVLVVCEIRHLRYNRYIIRQRKWFFDKLKLVFTFCINWNFPILSRLAMEYYNIFQGKSLPNEALLAGYSYLIQKYAIKSYVRFSSCVSKNYIRGNMTHKDGWFIYDRRYYHGDEDIEHLVFAIKHEYIDLLSLKRILENIEIKEIESYIRSKPTGIYARKIWFFYEWFNEKQLNIPDCNKCKIIDILDDKKYFVGEGILYRRYRLRNNLLGNKLFSPIIRRTEKLEEFIRLNLKEKTATVINKVSVSLVERAASFLLLSDSKASFEIEGEKVPATRIGRWGKAISQAGKYPLSKNEITRLQNILINDTRFIHMGLRKEGVFLGERDSAGNPLPEFIGAEPEDLEMLVDAIIDSSNNMHTLDPVLHAVAIAFGFIYIHPLEDGNGRIHRYIIHHILAERKFSLPGLIFPISTSMLKHIEKYREILRNHTLPLMDLIEWKPNEKMNVMVLGQTSDLYSYFDCTQACEFIYSCVKETIDIDLPEELNYLINYDQAINKISNLLNMPDNTIKKLIVFIRQNNGTLGKNRRTKEFAELTNDEVIKIENIVNEAFTKE